MKTKTKIDYNSSNNQKIKGDFVGREVLACFSYEMEAILRAEQDRSRSRGKLEYPLPTYEGIENLYENKCNYCGETFSTNLDMCPECEKAGHIEELDSQPQEIFEWWIVTEYLYRKLKEKEEPVLEWGNNYYWGRTCSGQAILLDHVISEICEEMEILDGQTNSWNK